MAGIIANVDGDIQKLRALKNEIEDVKKSLKGINVKVDVDIKEQAEARLKSLITDYDTLGRKVSETAAKIEMSTQNIIKATDELSKAQDKLSQAAKGSSGTSSAKADTAQTKGQTSSVEQQAKAYEDLRDQIDAVLGTRDQNIRRMVEEQNAIRLVNAEINEINKTRLYGGTLSKAQMQRLQMLNDSLLQHKTALSEVRQELANNAKMDIAASTSMDAMSQSLSRMRVAYRSLSEEERESPFGKELLASIQQADTKIKELDSSIGNNQRNVGNYRSGWSGLDMSVQQIVRELPSATMGINMFFLAISNNLPILADEIKYAKAANSAMKAAGGEPVPVWQQLIKSLLSWQTVMMVGISLLTVYGKDIVNWVKNIFSGNEALQEATAAAKAHAEAVKKMHQEWTDSVAESASKQISEYRKLQDEWNKLGNNMKAKKFFIRANQSAFNDLGYSVNNVTQAEDVLVKNTSSVVQAIMARAEAAAYQDEITSIYKRRITQMLTNRTTVKGGGYRQNFSSTGGPREYWVDSRLLDKVRPDKSGESPETNWSIIGNSPFGHKGQTLIRVKTKRGAKLLNEAATKYAKERFRINENRSKSYTKRDLGIVQKQLANVGEKANKANKSVGAPTYNKADYQQEQKDKRAEAAAERKQAAAERKQQAAEKHKEAEAQKEAAVQERIANIKTKAQLESERKGRDLEYDTTQAEINAMRDGSDKTLKQLELDKNKEVDKINRNYEDLKQTRIDNAKKLWDAGKHKGNFYQSSQYQYAASDDRYTEAQKSNRNANIQAVYATYNKGVNDETDKMRQSMNDYLKAYGSIQQQRAAIAAEYDQKIAETADTWAKRTLEQQKNAAVAVFDFNQFKKSIDWEEVFGNLTDLSLKALRDLKAKLQRELSSDMNPTDYKTIVDSINQIDDQISTKGHTIASAFGLAVPELDRIKRAQEDVIAYQQQLNDLITEQKNIETGISLDQQAAAHILANGGVEVNPADITEQNRQKILSYASSPDKKEQIQKIFDDIFRNQKNLNDNKQKQEDTKNRKQNAEDRSNPSWVTKTVAKLTGASQTVGLVNSNIQSLPMALKNLGVKEDSGLYKGMEQFAQGSQDMTNALKSLASGDVVGAIGNVVGAFKSLGNSVTTWFGLDGNNAKRIKNWQNVVERYKGLDKIWDSLISKKKEYLDMSWGTEAASTQEEIDKLYQSEQEGTQAETEAYLNTKAKHHGASHTQWTWSSRNWGGQEGFNDVASDLASKGFTTDKNGNAISISSVDDFFNLTYDELVKVMEDFPDKWNTMDSTLQGYMEDYMNELKNSSDSTQDYIDNIVGSISDLSSSMESLAKSSKTTVADVEDSFNDLYNSEVWEMLTKKGTKYYTEMEQFQKDFEAAESDGTLTATEAAALKKEYEDIYNETKDEYDATTSASGTDSVSQNATANGISSISYEQASNIEGIVTAINVEVSQSKDEIAKIDNIVDDTRDVIAKGYTELIGIHKDTTSIDKRIGDMALDVYDIKKSVKNM